MSEKTAAQRQRLADATRRWRERVNRRAAVYPVEIDSEVFDLMARLALLAPADASSRQRTATALGKLLRLALGALKRELGLL
jgi:hypothetical protein